MPEEGSPEKEEKRTDRGRIDEKIEEKTREEEERKTDRDCYTQHACLISLRTARSAGPRAGPVIYAANAHVSTQPDADATAC